MKKTLSRLAALLLVAFAPYSGPVYAGGQRVLVQSTTSTQNSGLYDYLLPIVEAETGLKIAVVAVGTGQAIRNATHGDADVLLVHAKPAELKFIQSGQGVKRFDLMYNDFVIIGPKSDPDGLSGAGSLNDALDLLASGQTPFISRGDDSGTQKKELRLWKTAGIKVGPGLRWYRESGSGMGATIRMAVEMNGYTLSDRATWIAFNHKMDHRIIYQRDPDLFNQYGIIMVNPAKHPEVNVLGAKKFMDWMLSPHGQALIADYRVGGQQLFFPNASANPGS